MIHYRTGYKHQLTRAHVEHTHIRCGAMVANGFLKLESDGTLNILEGYAWDGASGPAMDTPTIMAASLVHDALYQLMREKLISRGLQTDADFEFYRVMRASCREQVRLYYYSLTRKRDGPIMRWLANQCSRIYATALFIRCGYSFLALQAFGSFSTDPLHNRRELTAP